MPRAKTTAPATPASVPYKGNAEQALVTAKAGFVISNNLRANGTGAVASFMMGWTAAAEDTPLREIVKQKRNADLHAWIGQHLLG